ncbi:reverse transcriptase [Phytophthora megakarya]|uniref:Reverse transcriptase n=1 Tax=Phytophthora megakarya TaxID=4795 RepID=A0A225UZ88_9STRA|nr:reverse transcriptase [Phytophthora megakarya]
MDLSYASAVGQQKKKGSNVRCFRCGIMGHYARECTAPVHSSQGQRGDTGYRHGQTKKGKDHHECLQRTRGAEVCSPSERESHCKVQDDMPNLVILKVKSMTKRADSLRLLVDSGASNNFFRQQSLPLLDFEEKHLEVRLATGAIIETAKRVIRARFSYKHRVFVEELLVLDLDDKFDMVLGMPAADTPNGASEPPSETVARADFSSLSARSTRAVTTPGVVDSKRPDTSRMFSAIKRRDDNSVSTLGVDTRSISKSRKFSAVRRRGDNAGLHEAGRDQAGLDDACPRVQEPAGGIKERSSISRPERNASESGIHKKK